MKSNSSKKSNVNVPGFKVDLRRKMQITSQRSDKPTDIIWGKKN